MSIASEITRLQGVKSDILQAISDKGVVVPAGSALDDCPGLIASISGGGGGGVAHGLILKNKWGSSWNWFFDEQDKSLNPFRASGGSVCLFSLTRYYINDIKKIEEQFDFYIKTMWNNQMVILSYGANNGSYDTGRLFICRMDGNDILFGLANSAQSWNYVYRQPFDITGRHKFKVFADLILDKVDFYLDDNKVYSGSFSYKPEFWCPGVVTDNYIISEDTQSPPGSFLGWVNNVQAKLYLENSYIRINDEMIFGYK